MKFWGLALIAVLAAMVATSAVAASGASEPAAMVLSKRDFAGKNARYGSGDVSVNVIQGLKGLGVKASGAYFTAAIPGNSPKAEVVSGAVYTTSSRGQARKAYAKFNSENGGGSKLALPLYGDEQVVLYTPGSSLGSMLVRQDKVVWQLSVEGAGVVISESRLIAELKKYGARLKARVRAGGVTSGTGGTGPQTVVQ